MEKSDFKSPFWSSKGFIMWSIFGRITGAPVLENPNVPSRGCLQLHYVPARLDLVHKRQVPLPSSVVAHQKEIYPSSLQCCTSECFAPRYYRNGISGPRPQRTAFQARARPWLHCDYSPVHANGPTCSALSGDKVARISREVFGARQDENSMTSSWG